MKAFSVMVILNNDWKEEHSLSQLKLKNYKKNVDNK